MFLDKLTMQYILTNTLSIVHSTRVNNTVHTYTVYVTCMRKSAYKCTQTPTYIYCVSPLLLTILEICKLHVIPYKKGVLDSYDYL